MSFYLVEPSRPPTNKYTAEHDLVQVLGLASRDHINDLVNRKKKLEKKGFFPLVDDILEVKKKNFKPKKDKEKGEIIKIKSGGLREIALQARGAQDLRDIEIKSLKEEAMKNSLNLVYGPILRKEKKEKKVKKEKEEVNEEIQVN
eukprot:TRINITY_DN1176_c0_g1_i1.p2 TRINITY_DN1176_c0_g1~~TRINITY_DN1176_c0_g1_i1.p2  ORF type:complete len:145 (+),score=28.20 TRINITY_DN1176_c0_g1_i1:716-1150(+)